MLYKVYSVPETFIFLRVLEDVILNTDLFGRKAIKVHVLF